VATDFKVRPTVNGTGVLLVGEGSGVTGSYTCDMTDGDFRKRCSRADAAVTATSKVFVMVQRPNLADDSADDGRIYDVNVVRVYTGGFDTIVAARGPTGDDLTELGGGEVVTVNYLVA
jgi:hypothetical protein